MVVSKLPTGPSALSFPHLEIKVSVNTNTKKNIPKQKNDPKQEMHNKKQRQRKNKDKKIHSINNDK